MARMPADERRAALVAAALRVLAREGIAGTTTRAIVAEAGMPLGAFHYCFESKDELLRQLSGVVVVQEFTAAAAALQPGADIRTSISEGLGYWFDYVEGGPDQQQVLFELGQYARRSTALEGLDREQYQVYWAAAEQVILAFGAAAAVSWTVPVETLARFLVANLDGITLGWLADRDGAAARAALGVLAETLVSLTVPLVPAAEQVVVAPVRRRPRTVRA
jgi:AcrR family transcriptional regulator